MAVRTTSGRGRPLAASGEGLLAEQEDGLAWPDEAQLFARHPLDGPGVPPQSVDLVGETPVLEPELLDLPAEGTCPPLLLPELQQAAVAEQGAHDQGEEHDHREQQARLPA